MVVSQAVFAMAMVKAVFSHGDGGSRGVRRGNGDSDGFND